MKMTILSIFAILCLCAPLAWGGGCTDGSCADAKPQQEGQSLTGRAPEAQQQTRGRTRDASIDDFVTPGRAVEKDCGSEQGCREQGKAVEGPRTLDPQSVTTGNDQKR